MIRVLVADDHVLFREGLVGIIERWDDFTVIGEASTGEEAVALAAKLDPDLVLMDVNMPRMDGLSATRAIAAASPAMAIVMLTVSEDRQHLIEAIDNGARGYVLKDTPSRRLRSFLRDTMDGKSALSAAMAAKLFGQPRGTDSSDFAGSVTARERDVLELVAHGFSNRQVATRLGLSENTVKKYLGTIMRKLGAANRVEVATLAMSHGLVRTDNPRPR